MKAGPTIHDRMVIARMYKAGDSVQVISAHTRVRREQIEKVISTVEDGTFKGPREAVKPVTVVEKAQQEAAAALDEVARLKAELELAKEPTRGQKAAATRKANQEAAKELEPTDAE